MSSKIAVLAIFSFCYIHSQGQARSSIGHAITVIGLRLTKKLNFHKKWK
ncbi:MAG TPA: hypothetical protein VGM31_22355 [Puia sp.]